MNKVLIKALQWLIHSNIYIAIAATSFLWANILLLQLTEVVPLVVYIHVFSSTLCIYQLSRWAYHKRFPTHIVKDNIYYWIDKNMIFMKLSIIISAAVAGISLLFLNTNAKYIVGISGFISILYPLSFRYKSRFYRLRDVPLIKIVLISIVWAASTVLLPASYEGIMTSHILLFILQCIFILVITIPFDINDMDTDKANNVLTLPILLGFKNAVRITILFTLIYVSGLYYWLTNYPLKVIREQNLIFITGMIVLFSLLILFTAKKSYQVSKWVIMSIYDGSMILYAFWTVLVYTLSK